MKYARIVNNIVQEIFIADGTKTLSETFHPDVCALFEEIPDEVEINFSLINGEWTPPPPAPEIPEQTAEIEPAT